MNSLNSVSVGSLVIAGGILSTDILGITLPKMVTDLLSNQMYQIVLGISIVVASYYHLPTAIVLASILYVALNQKSMSKDKSKSKGSNKNKLLPGSHTVLKTHGEVNNTGVPGVPSDPSIVPIENPLPTQDNSAPKSTKTNKMKERVVEESTDNESMENVSGFAGNDLAPSL